MTKKRVNGVLMDKTEAEEAQHLLDIVYIQGIKDAETAATAKKASGKQKLKDLGLDDEEIKALTGA